MNSRPYPVLSDGNAPLSRPVSFVVVRFSDDYVHNILRSSCVHDRLNELITIDNRGNLFYDNLSEAMNAGLDKAKHELVAVLHEDVLLPDGWQQHLERSLLELEKVDPDWGLLGCVGWDEQGNLIGHSSDPHAYRNTLGNKAFAPVKNLDEQLMILRVSSGVRFDDQLPSIHNVGRELYSSLKEQKLATYVVNAPTIHKYADQNGELIETAEDSPKIVERRLPSFIADRACSYEYLYEKWPEWRPDDYEPFEPALDQYRHDVKEQLDRPVILLSRGGSGSRLLSWLALDSGVFLGNELNLSGDAKELVQDLYMGVLNKFLHRADWQRARTVPRIRHSAASMLDRSEIGHSLWGFKLPECMLILPELAEAFPEARYVHLIRDPLATCLRRTHMTARFDNTIGRVAIREAYKYCDRDLERSLDDSPGLHMAYTTVHQLETVRDYALSHLGERYLEIRFEDLLKNPAGSVKSLGQWLGSVVTGARLENEVDPERAANPGPEHRYPQDVVEAVTEALDPLRQKLGYL